MTSSLRRTEPDFSGDVFLPIRNIQQTMNELFSDMFRNFTPTTRSSGLHWSPALNLLRDGNHLVVELALPGFSKDQIEIHCSGDTLTISGEQEEEKQRKDEDYETREIGFGRFYRSVQLPGECDASNVKASLKDGLLKVEVPLVEHARMATRVNIS